jgi:GntR family transcriptional regulator
MLLRLDPQDDAPLFVQLANALRIAIVRGDAGPGERLPPARDLAASLDINVHTVLHAYQELRDEGLVDLRRGRGATVAAAAAQDFAVLRTSLSALAGEARRLGLSAAAVSALLKEEGLK